MAEARKGKIVLLDISGVLLVGHEPNHELIEYLRLLDANVRYALLTNLDEGIERVLSTRYRIPEFYDEVISADETGYAKPHPKMFEAALRRLGVKPEECICVDDSEENVAAARSLGMEGIFYRDFSSFRRELESLL